MASKRSQQPKEHNKGRIGAPSMLNVTIDDLDTMKDTCGIPPARAAFGSVSALLTVIRVRFLSFWRDELLIAIIQDSVANEQDYIDLGLSCAEICKILDRGLEGRRSDELGQPVLGAIEQFTT